MQTHPPLLLTLILSSCTACAAHTSPLPASPEVAHAAPVWVTSLDRDSPLVGKIRQPAAAAFVDERALFAALAGADFVLLGEQHDNVDHHRLQAEAIAALVLAGRRPTVLLEMLEPDDDAVVSGYRGNAQATAAGLGPLLAWEKRGWSTWSAYLPIADVAFRANLPFASANLPQGVVRDIAHRGLAAVPASDALRLGLDVPLAPPLESSLEDELRASHCGQLPEAMVGSMALAQRARDGQMASRMLSTSGPVVLIAGAGHVRNDRGVPLRLRAASAGRGVVSVAFVEVDARHGTPGEYSARYGATSLPFDFVWFTPRANDDDPCAGFSMSHHLAVPQTAPSGK